MYQPNGQMIPTQPAQTAKEPTRTSRFGTWWQKSKLRTWWERNKKSLIIIAIVVIVLLIAFALAVHQFGWDRTGFYLNFFLWIVVLGFALWRGPIAVHARRESLQGEITEENRRKVCRQIASHAQSRLTTSGVLAGLSVAAFAALFAALSPTPLGPNWHPEDHLVILDAAFVLAIATLTFLAATLSAYQVVKCMTLILQQDTEEVYQLHYEADGSIAWGLLELAIALLLIAFQISVIVGAAAALWMLGVACSRPTLIRALCRPTGSVTMNTALSQVPWGRVLLTGVLVAVFSMFLSFLVIIVYAITLGIQARGQPDQAQIRQFAPWCILILAILLTVGGAFRVARKVAKGADLHGLLVGLVVAIIVLIVGLAFSRPDLVALVPFVLIVAAGWLGGVLGSRER